VTPVNDHNAPTDPPAPRPLDSVMPLKPFSRSLRSTRPSVQHRCEADQRLRSIAALKRRVASLSFVISPAAAVA
jgi:hypothetical protein